MKKQHLALCALLVIILGGYYLANREPKHTSPFLFGAVLPVSGTASSSGQAQSAGLVIARRELEGKIGTTTPFLIEDSALDPAQGKSAAQALVAAHVSAMYSSFTIVTREVSEVARVASTSLFYDSCNCGFAQANPYAFQLYVDPRKECRQAAQEFKTKGATGAAFVGQDVPYAHFCVDELSHAFGTSSVQSEFDQQGIMRPYQALFDVYKDKSVGFAISLPISSYAPYIIKAAAAHDVPFICFAAQCLTPAIQNKLTPQEQRDVIAFDFKITPAFEEAIKKQVPGITHDLVVAAAVSHDALVYAATAYDRCGDAGVACIQKTALHPLVPLAIESRGFDASRILIYTTRYIRGTGEISDAIGF